MGIENEIVPDFAKSAGTLMAIGADAIVMSDTSELGPIDPQVTMVDGQGNQTTQSVQAYLGAYDELSKKVRKMRTTLPPGFISVSWSLIALFTIAP